MFKPQCISFYVVPVLLVCANRTTAWRHRAVFHTKCKWSPLFEKDLPENCQVPLRGVSRHVWFLAHEGHCSCPAFTVATSHLDAPLLRENLHAKSFPLNFSPSTPRPRLSSLPPWCLAPSGCLLNAGRVLTGTPASSNLLEDSAPPVTPHPIRSSFFAQDLWLCPSASSLQELCRHRPAGAAFRTLGAKSPLPCTQSKGS